MTAVEGPARGTPPGVCSGEPALAQALFDPISVAVVGASDNPEKWGYWLAKGALAGRGRRIVHLVNRRGGSLDGVPFHASLDGVSCEHVVVAVLALAPLTHARARALLLELRHAALLTGWRGAPPVHLDAAAAAVCAITRAAAEHPELAELKVNPLLVHPKGALALDAHAVLQHPKTPHFEGS